MLRVDRPAGHAAPGAGAVLRGVYGLVQRGLQDLRGAGERGALARPGAVASRGFLSPASWALRGMFPNRWEDQMGDVISLGQWRAAKQRKNAKRTKCSQDTCEHPEAWAVLDNAGCIWSTGTVTIKCPRCGLKETLRPVKKGAKA